MCYNDRMTEELPKGPEKAKEKNWEDMTPEEQDDYCTNTMPGLGNIAEKHPEIFTGELPPEQRREAGPEIAQLEELMATFEATHSLPDLHAITDLIFNEAMNHPVRRPAELALRQISDLHQKLIEQTNISSEEAQRLREKYRPFSRAVGIVNHGKVDHTRG